MKWVFAVAACAGLVAGNSLPALADDPSPTDDLARAQLARVIAVLQIRPDAAGQSCLDSLHEIHQTEDQVKILQGKAKAPDLPIAGDVLESDYENGTEICGADAARVCAAPSGSDAGRLTTACGALHSRH